MFLRLYIPTISLIFVFDMVWLNFIAKSFYTKHIGYLLSDTPNLFAAVCFYLIFAAGLVVFVIMPELKQKNKLRIFLKGAFFGLVTYATYDLTNLATINNWPLIVTLVDLCWGTGLSGVVSMLAYSFVQSFEKSKRKN